MLSRSEITLAKGVTYWVLYHVLHTKTHCQAQHAVIHLIISVSMSTIIAQNTHTVPIMSEIQHDGPKPGGCHLNTESLDA